MQYSGLFRSFVTVVYLKISIMPESVVCTRFLGANLACYRHCCPCQKYTLFEFAKWHVRVHPGFKIRLEKHVFEQVRLDDFRKRSRSCEEPLLEGWSVLRPLVFGRVRLLLPVLLYVRCLPVCERSHPGPRPTHRAAQGGCADLGTKPLFLGPYINAYKT